MAAQPGSLSAEKAPSHRALNNWIFHETVLGEAIIDAGRRLTETGDDRLRILRGWLIPEGYWPDGTTWGVGDERPDRLALADEANELLAGPRKPCRSWEDEGRRGLGAGCLTP